MYEEYVTNFNDSLLETWIGVARKVDLEEKEVCDWIMDAWDLDKRVAVLCLSHVLLWIDPATQEDGRRLSFGGRYFADGPLKRIDKWTETLEPVVVADWVLLHWIPS